MPPLTLEVVLASVRPGRVVRLELTREQKRALRGVDGQLALGVLRHLVGAREALGAVGRFPLTESTFRAVARKLGHEVGQKRARALARRLIQEGVMEEAGHYRQPHRNSGTRSGYHVRLLRLVVAVTRTVVRVVAASGKKHSPVGRQASVKTPRKLRCWQHPLYGDYSGLPPPHLTDRDAKRMRSLDEVFQDLSVAFDRCP